MMRTAARLGFRSVEDMQDDLEPQEVRRWLAFELVEFEQQQKGGCAWSK